MYPEANEVSTNLLIPSHGFPFVDLARKALKEAVKEYVQKAPERKGVRDWKIVHVRRTRKAKHEST
jgi:hypothetical protein